MKVFLTGNKGKIGRVLEPHLRNLGYEVVGYDLVDGRDVLDPVSIETAIGGCESVIHLAASLGGPQETPQDIMQVNVQGTWNILTCAAHASVSRVVYMSSVNALGVFMGEAKPVYLPLDDEHPCSPTGSYGISKLLAEEMCRLWSNSIGLPVICLRPPGVWTKNTYHEIVAARKADPLFEWEPFWEYGAFIDIRDLAQATARALTCPCEEFVRLLIASTDITTSGKTSRELAQKIHPDVEWRGGREFDDDPFRSLLNTNSAQNMLGWTPEYTWRRFLKKSDPG